MGMQQSDVWYNGKWRAYDLSKDGGKTWEEELLTDEEAEMYRSLRYRKLGYKIRFHEIQEN